MFLSHRSLFSLFRISLPAFALSLAFGVIASAPASAADEVIRHKIPNSTFPISKAVEVPAGMTTVYLSGTVPSIIDDKADKNTKAAYGDTKTQTISVLKTIESDLKALGLTMGDVIKMQVFLVGDADKGGKMDFAGFMEGYTQFFGTKEQPNLPSRSAFQIAALGNPGWLIEIEVTAVRKKK